MPFRRSQARRLLLSTLLFAALFAFAGALVIRDAAARPAPAAAPAATGVQPTTLRFAGAAARALQAAGVTVRPLAPARRTGGHFTVPVRAVRDDGTVVHNGGLRLLAGRRTVVLRGLRLRAGSLTAAAGGIRGPLRLTLRGGRLTLPPAAARALRAALARPGLVAGPLGALDAPATRSRAIVGGTLDWGFAAPVRAAFSATGANYNTGEPFRRLSGGASQNADDTFRFPLGRGSWEAGGERATIAARGSVRLGYQVGGAVDDGRAHGIWVTLSDLVVELDGARGTLSGVTDAGFHDSAPVVRKRRVFADLDLRAARRVLGAGGATVSWNGIRATLTRAGEPLGLGMYHAGFALDPLTVTARLRGASAGGRGATGGRRSGGARRTGNGTGARSGGGGGSGGGARTGSGDGSGGSGGGGGGDAGGGPSAPQQPAPNPRPVLGGAADWGFSAALRGIFPLDGANTGVNPADPGSGGGGDYADPYWFPHDGATRNASAASFRFPATGGSYDAGRASGTVELGGGLRIGYMVGSFASASNRGTWLRLADPIVTIDGAGGTLSAVSEAGSGYEPGGASRIVPSARRAVAALTLPPPTRSADGTTLTWSGVRAALTGEGAPLGLGVFTAGTQLDPLTLSIRIGG
ncbi:HtaA domain-containing protein [Conexibacter sp. CPCC 206217]|uniref:HtaA domain-containing protein n=1 Tax=Conexibacter sp. CPCC 206217 TaxID=3064574 RepID=UPI00271B5F38|nr:HtaA domain-containing protein [Conexibacter sp. CPCC 206217]MDO8208768.1 HtaA domain-containing protein [Conexibacter sp. CPCC 206217]